MSLQRFAVFDCEDAAKWKGHEKVICSYFSQVLLHQERIMPDFDCRHNIVTVTRTMMIERVGCPNA